MQADIIAAIDKQIAQFQQPRGLIAGSDTLASVGKSRRGRPKGSKQAEKASFIPPKRVMSAEGRAKIAAAQRKRHAARKRAANKIAAAQTAVE